MKTRATPFVAASGAKAAPLREVAAYSGGGDAKAEHEGRGASEGGRGRTMSDAKDGKDKAGGKEREPLAKRGATTTDADFRRGDSCGDYEVVEFVAAGGMGVVYKAKGKFGGLIVALKCIRTQLLERADMLERFETEARILAQLSSKNRYIVRLLHAGKHEGIPFIVMEWLDGVTLRDFLNGQRKPIELKEGLHYASCIARALCAAHAEGILHRDLKPENILMRKRGGLKVLDFGLGKLTEGDRVSTSERLGGMCTPHYSAPEQLDRSGVDERTDVYALALIVMEILTGCYAFADAPRVLPDRQVACANQFAAEPNSLRALRPECSASLAELIDRALSKDKTKRPGSVEFLAAVLQERASVAAKTGAEAPALDDEDSDDESIDDDSVDEPAPSQAQRTSEPANETSLIRRLPKLKTDVLPADFEPPDPSAIGNPLPPPPPPQQTIKMAPSSAAPNPAAEQSPDAASSSTHHAWAVSESDGETTSRGRSATLPPEPETHEAPVVGPTPAPSEAPRATMPASLSPAPSEMNDSPAARASIELANRPTSPWIRPAPLGGPVSATPAPTQRGVPTAPADATGKPIPMWPAVVIGVSVAVAGFAILIAVRGHQPERHPAVASTSPPAVVSAASATPSAAVATSASAAPAEPALAPVPVASVEATPAAPATPNATGAPSASSAPATKVATPAASVAPPSVGAAPAPPAALAKQKPLAPEIIEAAPEPIFFRRKPDASAQAATRPASAPAPKPAATQPAPAPVPTASASHRVFGSEN